MLYFPHLIVFFTVLTVRRQKALLLLTCPIEVCIMQGEKIVGVQRCEGDQVGHEVVPRGPGHRPSVQQHLDSSETEIKNSVNTWTIL